MRITCPRCDAQYEVPDASMPPGGRDVQCSSCGHHWYQLVPREAEPQAVAEADVEPEADAAPSPQKDSARRLQRLRAALDDHRARAAAEAPQPGADAPAEATPEDTMPPEPALDDSDTAPPARRRLDPAVAAVLRAEAEFERNARAHGPAFALEMQPELDLVVPPRGRDADSVRERLARLQAAEQAGTPLPAGEDSYPDPDGLGRSLLRHDAPEPKDDASTDAPPVRAGLPVRVGSREIALYEARQARRAFRRGYAAALVVCLAAPALYFATPYLADAIPSQAALFERIARTGAEIHVTLAGALQGWLVRLGDWMDAIGAPTV